MAHRSYVPVLRVLGAEMAGAAQCDSWTKEHITPLFRIVRSRDKETAEKYLGRAVNSVISTWAHQSDAFVELEDLPQVSAAWINSHPVSLIHDVLRARGVRSIPVLPTHGDAVLQDAVFEVVKRYGCNLGVRIYYDDLEVPVELISKIEDIARRARVELESMDLLVDLGFIPNKQLAVVRGQIVDFLSHIDRATKFSSITIIGSSIPNELKNADVPHNSIREILKSEEHLWRFASRNTKMRIGAGDYSVVRADYVDVGGPFPHINGKLFYSVPGRMVICRGRSRKKEGLELQYARLAKMLVNSSYFLGGEFSWGDTQLLNLSNGRARVGDPTRMIEIGTAHHLTQMAHQMIEESVSYVS